MPISFRGISATAVIDVSTSITLSAPVGSAANDVLLAHFKSDVAVAPTAPAGWTLDATSVGTLGNSWVFRAVWTAGLSHIFTVSNTGSYIAHERGYIGVDNTTPDDATPTQQNNASSTTGTAPSITTVTDNAWWVAFFGFADAVTTFSTFTNTAPLVNQGQDTFVGANTNFGFSSGNAPKTPPGATGLSTTTSIGGAGNNQGITIALKPVVAAVFAPDEDYIVVMRSWQSQSMLIAVPSSDAAASPSVVPEDDALVVLARQPFVPPLLTFVADEVLGIPPPAFTPDEDYSLPGSVPASVPLLSVVAADDYVAPLVAFTPDEDYAPSLGSLPSAAWAIPVLASDDDALAWAFLGAPDEDYLVVGNVSVIPLPWVVVAADEPVVTPPVAFVPDEDYFLVGSSPASPSAWLVVTADDYTPPAVVAFTPDEDVALIASAPPLPLPWAILPDDSIPAGSLSVAAFTPDEDSPPITRVTQWRTQGVVVFGGDAGASPTVPPTFVPDEDYFIVPALPFPTTDLVQSDDDPPAGSLIPPAFVPDEDYQGVTPIRWAGPLVSGVQALDDQISLGGVVALPLSDDPWLPQRRIARPPRPPLWDDSVGFVFIGFVLSDDPMPVQYRRVPGGRPPMPWATSWDDGMIIVVAVGPSTVPWFGQGWSYRG
jgi:hypothetical protein